MKLRFSTYLILAWLGVSGSSGMDLSNLTERSPFAPAGAGRVSSTAEEVSQLEFRSIASDQAGMMFSVFDVSANRGRWLRLGENGSTMVKSFDAAQNEISVEHQGKVISLKLKRATIQAGAAMPSAGVPAMPSIPGGVVNNGSTATAAPTDSRRLEAVAAEVRRRRALRTAAQVPANAAAPTPATVEAAPVVPPPPVP